MEITLEMLDIRFAGDAGYSIFRAGFFYNVLVTVPWTEPVLPLLINNTLLYDGLIYL